MVSSGAIMPARPPASIDMLQTVSRPSMREAADGGAGIFDGMPDGPRGADLGDDGEDDVLGEDALGEPPSTAILSVLGFCCQSDWVASTCPTSEAPMPKASAPSAPWVEVWRIAAHQGEARLGQALLGTDDVDDALARVAQVEDGHPVLGRVERDQLDHAARLGIGDRRDVAACRRHVMVRCSEGALGPAQLETPLGQDLEGMARAVVDQVAVDVEERLPVVALDDLVALPDLLEECLRRRRRRDRHGGLPLRYSAAGLRRASSAGDASRKRSRKGSHSSAPMRRKTSRTVAPIAG